MNGKLVLAIALTGAILGMSTTYWLQAAVNNKRTVDNSGISTAKTDESIDNIMGIKWDRATFGICIITSLLALISICLLMSENGLFHKLSMGISVILCIMWIAMLIVYCVRKYDDPETFKEDKDKVMIDFSYVRKSIDFKRREIVEAVLYMLFAGASALFHLLAGVLKK